MRNLQLYELTQLLSNYKFLKTAAVKKERISSYDVEVDDTIYKNFKNNNIVALAHRYNDLLINASTTPSIKQSSLTTSSR